MPLIRCSFRLRGARVTSSDPREILLHALAAKLHCGPLARRRILRELAHHIDDAVDELRGSGIPREEAIEEAVKRLGDAETIAHAFDDSRTQTTGWAISRMRPSLAWIAVAAMSVVTALAAELPQVSGAKPPARGLAHTSPRLATRPSEHPAATSLANRDRHASQARPRR